MAATAPDRASRAAWVWAKPDWGNLMKLTDRLTMRPKPRSHMPGATCCIRVTDDRKWSFSHCRHSASPMSA